LRGICRKQGCNDRSRGSQQNCPLFVIGHWSRSETANPHSLAYTFN
jgi:hypothetical protein